MKIFISDLDGTLLDNTFQSDDSVLACISNVLATNNDFVIATGRSYYGIKTLNFYKLPIYYIIMNGAIILDRNKEIIYKRNIPKQIVQKINQRYPKDNIEYITATNTYMTISKEEYLQNYQKWEMWRKKMIDNGNEKQLDFMLSHFIFNADISMIEDQVVKINMLELNDDTYAEKTAYVAQINEIINNPFDKNVLELTANDTTKYTAIKKLTEINNWDPKNIYVFGDGKNDCDMLRNFANSFAPSNASADAKNSANHILGNCTDKAIVNYINEIIKI